MPELADELAVIPPGVLVAVAEGARAELAQSQGGRSVAVEFSADAAVEYLARQNEDLRATVSRLTRENGLLRSAVAGCRRRLAEGSVAMSAPIPELAALEAF